MSTPSPNILPAIVIGAGISGLTCAYRLHQAGIQVRLLEAGNRPGGVIATTRQDDCLFELGPQSFLGTIPVLDLIKSLGITYELLRANSRAPRFILHHGRLVRAPLSPLSLLTTPLFSMSSKWRLLTEIMRHSDPPVEDESIAAFVRRKYGEDVLQNLVAPFVSGIYAGDPEKLSLRSAFPALHEFETQHGSILRGAIKSRTPKSSPRAVLCSFRNGMETLPRAIAAKLEDALVTGASVASIRRVPSGSKSIYEVDVVQGDRRDTLLANSVILTVPCRPASYILKDISLPLADRLSQVPYAPLAVVAASYRNSQLKNARGGFGFLVPRSEGLSILGSVWNSSLFPGRAPEGMSSFASFVGGATDPGISNMREDEISELVCSELGKILGITGSPVTRLVHRYTRAIPQYNLGHAETIAAIMARTAAIPGLFFAGNWLTGPSIGACVEQASRVAEQVRNFLQTSDS